MTEKKDSFEIPRNGISCFIGRVCEEPGENFEKDGILWIDTFDLDGSKGGPAHGEEGTTQRKAIASWTLRSAFIAWNKPPKITFKGHMKLKGKISMPNAMLSNVTLAGGPPLMGTTLTAAILPGITTVPFAISSATGTAKIEQPMNAELDVATDGDKLDIELTSQTGAQLPWCVSSSNAADGDSTDEEGLFINKGDFALCMAFGNSLSNLYVVDIFR
jgi:hypothetical protein